ncbi:MAG: hypothetical protein Q9190_003363 [Brigantiaea leucoxantha]
MEQSPSPRVPPWLIVNHSFSSFIQSQGQLLLDLSLYVSSINYHSTTRPTYSSLLSWPHSWILPSQRRIVAKSRTEYLRLSSLDLDAADAARQQQLQQQFPTGTEIPKIIQERQRTALSLLKAPEHAARFRLDALAEDFFKPLDELLADKEWLLGGDEPTSLDCLALGYLALALRPAVPQPWLAESLTKNYPRLHRYVDAVIQHFFGSSIGPSDALPDPFQPTASSLSSPKLPWRTPSRKSLLSTVSEVSSTALENLPLFGNLFKPNPLSPSVAFNDPAASALPLLVPAVALGIISSLVSVVGYGLYSGEVPFSSHWLQGGRRTREKSLRDMGEAGVMLGAVDFGGV